MKSCKSFYPANPDSDNFTSNKQLNYEEIIARDKTSLDITWVKDKSLGNLDNLPNPDMLAEEIAENLESALGSFREVIRHEECLNQDLQDYRISKISL